MKTLFLSTLIFIVYWLPSQAQEQRCGFTHIPNLQQEQILKQFISQKSQTNNRTEDKIYTIPVLFHIIQTNNPTDDVNKLTSTQLREQLKILNNDYTRLNSDTINTPTYFKNIAGKLAIKFVLADYDTTGLLFAEKGIIRYNQFSRRDRLDTEFNQEIKQQTIRNPTLYLNIWIYENVIASRNGKSLLGYAQFPDFSTLQGLKPIGGIALTDGVAIAARTLVGLGQNQPITYQYGLGRTLTHEVAHFFGVLHTFDDSGQGLCVDNDFCMDTPSQKYATKWCKPTETNKCESLIMSQNFLDYTDDACMNLFTICQIERMKVVLEKCPRRKELTTSTVTSVRDENLAESIHIFPNPTNTFFTIEAGTLQLKNLRIFSMLGQEVYHTQEIQANLRIDVSGFSKAIYVLQLETESGILVKKLVIK